MPEALRRYHAGASVEMTCYQEGCERVSIPVVLGKKGSISPMFDGKGRFNWVPDRPVKLFYLTKSCICPNCKTLFTAVVIVSIGGRGRSIIFGYNPEAI